MPRPTTPACSPPPGTRYHALIDVGALITGLTNLDVAKALSGPVAPANGKTYLDGVDGVVFLDEQVCVCVTDRRSERRSEIYYGAG